MTRLAEVVIKVPPCFEGGPLEKSTPPRWFPFPGWYRERGLFFGGSVVVDRVLDCGCGDGGDGGRTDGFGSHGRDRSNAGTTA